MPALSSLKLKQLTTVKAEQKHREVQYKHNLFRHDHALNPVLLKRAPKRQLRALLRVKGDFIIVWVMHTNKAFKYGKLHMFQMITPRPTGTHLKPHTFSQQLRL